LCPPALKLPDFLNSLGRRLLRYCARPPFALDRLRELGPERLRYEVTKPGPGGAGSLLLTPVELIDRIAALVPPPRFHRHRYFGVLALNAPLRTAVTALAPAVRDILVHLGEPTAPPRATPGRRVPVLAKRAIPVYRSNRLC
jgi:hypothetical protein